MDFYEVNGETKKLYLIGELQARYDSRQSFYGKANILEDEKGNKYLLSYSTIVSACIDGKIEHFGKWSQTTTRHQKEFEKQFKMIY